MLRWREKIVDAALQLRGITKSFNKVPVLEGLSFELQKGELLTLLGGSGCGKTTTLRIIAGLEKPDSGQISFNGQDITALPPYQRGIGMVFQDYTLFPNLNIFENVAYGLRVQKLPSNVIRSKVLTMLDHLEMPHSEKKFPHQLSGGQQQRIALARALVVEPSLLLMDEPFSALDAKIRESLRTLVRRVQKELGINAILVTHDREEALGISDHIAIFNGGRIVQFGTPEELYTRPVDVFVADFLTNASIFMHQDKTYQLRPETLKLDKENGDFKARIQLIKFQGSSYRVLLNYEGQSIIADVPILEFMNQVFHMGESVYVRMAQS